MQDEQRQQLAETVRRACIAAARQAYEEGGLSGLCGEGRWDLAVDAMRSLDVAALAAEDDPRGC